MEIESQIIWLAALYFQQEKFRRQLQVKANGVALWEGKVVNDLISLLLSGFGKIKFGKQFWGFRLRP